MGIIPGAGGRYDKMRAPGALNDSVTCGGTKDRECPTTDDDDRGGGGGTIMCGALGTAAAVFDSEKCCGGCTVPTTLINGKGTAGRMRAAAGDPLAYSRFHMAACRA